MDGLGRLVSPILQYPAGCLTQGTTYLYDTLDNLKMVGQGGQLVPFRLGSDGSLIATIRVSMDSENSGKTGMDEEGNDRVIIGVTEKTILVTVPFKAKTQEEIDNISKLLDAYWYYTKPGSPDSETLIATAKGFEWVEKRLRDIGFVVFMDLASEHTGGDDYKPTQAPWYHITAGHPTERDWLLSWDTNAPPPWITIHVDSDDPTSWPHIKDHIEKKTWWVPTVPWTGVH